LGAVANLSRNSVNRIVKALEAQGLVSVAYRAITLPDPARLRHLVDD
jgi:CRP-like cAMP-binding protein